MASDSEDSCECPPTLTAVRAKKRKIDELRDVVTDLAKTVSSMSLMMAQQQRQPPVVVVQPSQDLLPAFDPAKPHQSAETWVAKVEEIGGVAGWDDRTICHQATKALKGNAEVWAQSLTAADFIWPVWKEKFLAAFPPTRNFYARMEEMVLRKKQPGESYASYYFERMALLSSCHITGIDAVSCLLGGITDPMVSASAHAANLLTPEQVLSFLQTLPTTISSRVVNPPVRTGYPAPGASAQCYRCGKPGHIARVCQSTEPVWGVAAGTDKTKKVMLAGKNLALKYYKDAVINSKFNLKAFVDMGSECVLIRETDCRNCGLHVDTSLRRFIKGFGNNKLETLGQTAAKIITSWKR